MTATPENSSPPEDNVAASRRRRRPASVVQAVLEGVVLIAMCVVLAGGALVWRVATGPLDIGFADGYIEQALRDPDSGHSVDLGGAQLSWPDLRGPVFLDLENTRLLRGGQPVLSIGDLRIGLAPAPLLAGGIVPVMVALKSPALRLVRSEDNHVGLSLEDSSAAVAPADETGGGIMESILETLDGNQGGTGPLRQLRSVKINDARMVVEDHVLGITWYLRDLDLSFGRNDRGLEMTASLSLPGGRGGASRLDLAAIHYRDGGNTRVKAYVADFDPRIVLNKLGAPAVLDNQEIYVGGDIAFLLGPDLVIENAQLSLSAAEGSLVLDGVYDAPLPFESAALEGQYDRASGTVTLDRAAVTVRGVTAVVAGAANIADGVVTAPLTVTVPAAAKADIDSLWPAALRGLPVEEWILRRLSAGAINDAVVGMTVMAKKDDAGAWAADVGDVKADFRIDGMTVDYRAPLTAATEVNAAGHFEGDELSIAIDSAKVGGLSISGGTVKIDKIGKDDIGVAQINLDATGPLLTVFDYIAKEPISIDEDELGIKTAAVKGHAKLNIGVTFPTVHDLKAEHVKVAVSGTINDIYLPEVVKDMALTGGPLALDVQGTAVTLKGKGKLGGHDIDLSWMQYIESEGKSFSSRIDARVVADKNLRDRLGIGLDDWIEGSVPAHIVYTSYRDGHAEVAVDADTGPARVMVKPMQYEKNPGAPGTAKCTAILRNGFLTDVKNLDVIGPGLQLIGGALQFEQEKGETVLRRGNLPKVILGETDAGLGFEIGAGNLMKLEIKGDFLDASPFLDRRKKKAGPYEGPPVIASVDVARLRTRESRLVEKAKIYLDMGADGLINQLEVNASAGKGPIYLRLKPDSAGKLVFKFQADDAGAALRAFDVYENVEGGTLIMTGESVSPQSPRVIGGKAQLNDFRVIKAPVLARLVSAISPTGLPQLLGGEGIHFARLESGYEWRMRPAGDLYTIKDGRTSGSSLGLTFEGTINKKSNETDLKGQIVPVSEVNELIGGIPLIGDILTGGDALFAATYTVKGPSETPTVSVNPLAVLTPGILRKIFFEGGE